jgi:hypothetical protein
MTPTLAPRANIHNTPAAPRRLVLLCDGQSSAVEEVLCDYPAAEVGHAPIERDLHRLAAEHRRQYIAAEWRSPHEWVRYRWCRKP